MAAKILGANLVISRFDYITHWLFGNFGSLGFTVERVVYGGVRLVQGEM
jgi:hypothetical protein